jgi:Ser/Thr protein kinase RdoA (MazF antagonist)
VIERVAATFGLGLPVWEPVTVAGGLSNQLWRLDTDRGAFAVKRMVANAERQALVENVEAAFAIERRAWAAGVPVPEPVVDPSSGRALARIDGALFRVHRWVDGSPGSGSPVEAAGLLARIHAVGRARWAPTPSRGWAAERWGADLVELTRKTTAGPDRVLVVDSHGDLERKNTLRRGDGTVLALDWDAAGPVGAVHEAVGVALDWSDAQPGGFAEAVEAYVRHSGVVVPPRPWVFAGWVAAQGGWLDHNATHRADTALGRGEVQATRARLRRLATRMDALLAALPPQVSGL